MSFEGARAVAEGLKVNSLVTALDLQHNNLDQEAKDAIRAAWNGRSDNLKL